MNVSLDLRKALTIRECQRVHNNDDSNMHAITHDRVGQSVGIVSSYNGWLCSSSSKSLCMVIQNPTDMHSCSPTDLSITHIERRWQIAVMLTVDSDCVAWPTYKLTPTTWTSKLSQKLLAYTRVYTVTEWRCLVTYFYLSNDPHILSDVCNILVSVWAIIDMYTVVLEAVTHIKHM